MAVPHLRSHAGNKVQYIAQLLHILVIANFRVTGGSASTIYHGMMWHGLQFQMGMEMVP